MTAFSLGTIWEETIAFMRRESGLLIPVALAIFGPANLLLNYGGEAAAAMREAVDKTADMRLLLIFPGLLLYLYGNIVTTLLALVPGISVGEALARAGRRLSAALGAGFIVSAGLMLIGLAIIVAVTVGAMAMQVDPRSPAMASQLVAVVMIPMMVVTVRLLLLTPVAAMETGGPVDTVRTGWALGKGNMMRFFVVLMLASFLGIVVGVVERFVVGSLFQLVALASGEGAILSAIEAVINAAINSMLWLGVAIYVALIYRRLSLA